MCDSLGRAGNLELMTKPSESLTGWRVSLSCHSGGLSLFQEAWLDCHFRVAQHVWESSKHPGRSLSPSDGLTGLRVSLSSPYYLNIFGEGGDYYIRSILGTVWGLCIVFFTSFKCFLLHGMCSPPLRTPWWFTPLFFNIICLNELPFEKEGFNFRGDCYTTLSQPTQGLDQWILVDVRQIRTWNVRAVDRLFRTSAFFPQWKFFFECLPFQSP